MKKEPTMMDFLLSSFKASRSYIPFVVEKDSQYYQNPPSDDVIQWWKLLFCKSIVTLSISPNSRSRELNKDVLSSFVRGICNSKNSTVVRQLRSYLESKDCQSLIEEEFNHLKAVIEQSVCAGQSRWEDYYHTGEKLLKKQDLKDLSQVTPFLNKALDHLWEIFSNAPCSQPLQQDRYQRLLNLRQSIPDDQIRQSVLKLYSCAMILALNVPPPDGTGDFLKVDQNIYQAIERILEAPDPPPSAESPSDLADTDDRNLAGKIALAIARKEKIPQEQWKALTEEVEYCITFWKSTYSAIWNSYTMKEKFRKIYGDYQFEKLINDQDYTDELAVPENQPARSIQMR